MTYFSENIFLSFTLVMCGLTYHQHLYQQRGAGVPYNVSNKTSLLTKIESFSKKTGDAALPPHRVTKYSQCQLRSAIPLHILEFSSYVVAMVMKINDSTALCTGETLPVNFTTSKMHQILFMSSLICLSCK